MAEIIEQEEVQQNVEQGPGPKMSRKDFAAKIKAKYPDYKDIDDEILVDKIIAKYPDYKDKVDFEKKSQVQTEAVPSAAPLPSSVTKSPYVGTLPPGTPPTPKLTDKEKIELDKALMADAERAIAATQKPAKYIDYTAPPEVQARQKQIIEKELKTKPVGAPEKEKQGDVLNSIAALDRGFYKNLIGNPIKGLGTLLQLGGSKLEGISEKLGFITKEQRAYGKEPISQSLIDFGDWFNKTIDELAPQDEEFKGTLKDQFAQAFGQVGSLILTGGASAAAKGATATTATKAAQQIAGQIAPRGGLKEAAKAFTSDLASPVAVSSGLSMGQAEFDRAKEAGATDEQAFEAFWKNAAVGSVLERIPVMQFFKRFNNATQGGVANYIKTKGVAGLTGGIEEMTTEVLQQLYSNKTAQDIYNINQNLYEGIGESGGIGFGVGFLLNALGANAKILRKQGKIDEAKTVEAQIEQFKQKAEKGGESSYSWNGIPQQPDVIEKMIDNMTADELIKANIQIQNDPRLQSKLQVKISVSPIKEQVRQANPDLSEEALDKLTDLEIRLKNLENNTTQAAKDRVAEIKNEIKNITSGKKIIAGKFIGEFPGKPVEKLTIGESLDKSANYKGQQGTIAVDGPTVIFKVDNTGEEFELGRIDEVADMPLSDFELSTEVLEKAPPKKEENYRGYTIKDVSTETGEAGFFVIDADGDSLGEVFASPEEAKKVINAIEPQMERQKIKPKVEAVEQEVLVKEMAPITDEMVKIEREFQNQGYTIDWDYDNEIQIRDKNGEIVGPEDLPDNLKDFASKYEQATSKLGDYDQGALIKALEKSREVEEVKAEEVKPKEIKQYEGIVKESQISEEELRDILVENKDYFDLIKNKQVGVQSVKFGIEEGIRFMDTFDKNGEFVQRYYVSDNKLSIKKPKPQPKKIEGAKEEEYKIVENDEGGFVILDKEGYDATGEAFDTYEEAKRVAEASKFEPEAPVEAKEGESITLKLADKGKAEGVKIAIPGFENMDLVAVREGFNYNIYEATTGMQVAATSAFDLESAKSQIRDALLSKNVSPEKIFEAIIKGKLKQINESPAFTQYKAIKEDKESKKPFKYSEEEREEFIKLSEEAKKKGLESLAKTIESAANAKEDAKWAMSLEDAKRMLKESEKRQTIEQIKKENKPLPDKDKKILDDSEEEFARIINSEYEKDKYSTIPEEIRGKAYEAYKKMIAIHNKYGYYPKSIVEGFPAIGKSPAPDIALAWYIKAVNAKKIETRPARIKEAIEKLNQSAAKLDDLYDEEIGQAKPKLSKEKETIQEAFNDYEEEGKEYKTVGDLVDLIESLDIDELADAVKTFREEQEYDRELAGRGDMESAEENLLDAIKGYISTKAVKEEIAEISKPSKSELPLDQKGREVGNIEYKKGADHVTGRTITRTAPNGTKIKGTFKLVPAAQLIPSHNPITFTKNEAFPQTKDGKTINDRDYEADKPAQEQVVNIAQNLDGTAVTQMPTVSKEGIVYDGNNRTMSRQRAAKNKTDGEYLNAIKEQAEMYGFTEEQVDQIENPTLVFEVEENLPFDTNTMAVFNVAEKKAQSPVQRAVAISKRISDKAKRLLAGLYDQVETPSEVTSSPKMMKQAMDILVDEGLIQTLELPRFIDKGVATPDGISLLEGIVMAASLNESAITALSLEGMGNVKKMIIKNVVGLMQNSAKGENSLIKEIGKAIDIVQKASASKMSVLDYLSQYDVFSTKDYTLEEMCMALLLDTNKPSELKKFLSSYNSEVGIPSLLGEDVSKQALLDRKLNTLISSYEKIKKNLEGVAVKRAEPAKPSPEQAEQPPAKPIAEAPQKPAAEKSALEKAKEERKAAKDKLNNIRKRLGITPDPKEEARALFEYHKALVKEAKEYVKLGIKTVEDWAKEIGEKVNVALKTAWDEATGKISAIKKPEDLGYTPKELDDYRGIRIKDNEERRQELGMAPRETNPESFEKWDNEAERLLADGYNIEGLIAKMERGEATTPVENSIRKIFAATLDAELESNPTPENQALARRFVQASDVASRQAGLQLVSLKSNAEPLSTFTDFVVAKMEANAVDILTNEEIEAVKKQFEKVKAEKEKYQKLYNEAQNVIAKREAQKELNKAKKQIIKEGKRDYAAERQALKERLKKQFNDYIESTKKLGIASDGGAEGFAITVDMAKTIMEIVKSHTEEIGANLVDVTKRTVDDIKDIFTDIKEQDVIDVIAGKYADKKPPLSELQANLKDLRAEAKLLAELDRVMAGKPRDEREQRQKNQRLFQLKAEIDKIKREKGLDQYSTEEKVKRLIQQNLKREQEIKDKIARKEFDTERKPLSPYDDVEFKKNNPELYKKLLDSYNRKNDARHEFELELLRDEQAKATKIQKVLRIGEKIANTTKKAVTGIDDSFLFMQTLVAITRRPALGTKAFAAHIRDFASKKAYERSLAEIHNSELYPLMVQSGLDITEPKTLTQKAREEAYSGDTFDFYITIKGKEHKVLGSLFEPFERAATSLGNNMRVLSFAKISNKLMQEGYTFENNPEVFKDLARMLNTETGRGKLNESVEKASKLVTAGIWSPRLMASRMDLIGLTDALSFVVPGTSGYYRNMSPEIRKEAVRTAAQFSITILALSYVIAYGFGGDLDDDPTSQGFMDIKIGNKSYNLAGGFSQYIRLIAQTLKGGKTMDGRFVEFKGNKDRGSNVLHFTRGKLTPIGGVVADVFSGMKDFTGKPITVESELKRLWIPLSLQNVTKDVERDGTEALFSGTLPSFVGIGVKDVRDFNIKADLYTVDEEKKNQTLRFIINKGLKIPRLGYKNSIKIRIDENHPEGVMNDEEYQRLKDKVSDKLLVEINAILDKTYTIKEYDEIEEKEIDIEEGVSGEDLPAEQLKTKIESAKEKAVSEALEELGLKRPKRKPTAIEEKSEEEE